MLHLFQDQDLPHVSKSNTTTEFIPEDPIYTLSFYVSITRTVYLL